MSRPDDPDPPRPAFARQFWMVAPEPANRASGEGPVRRGTPAAPWNAEPGAEPSVEEATLRGGEQRATKGLGGLETSTDEVIVPVVAHAAPLHRLSEGQVNMLAAGVRAATGTSHLDDPRLLAYRSDIDVVAGCHERGEFPTAIEAVYVPHHDKRERGIRIYCAFARSFLLARGIAHGHGDVWALAVALAIPARDRWLGRVFLILMLVFCPETVICAYVDFD